MGAFTSVRSCERIIFSLITVLAPMEEDMLGTDKNGSHQTSSHDCPLAIGH